MNVAEANVLITGGASGLGKAMATYLAGKAATVIVADKNEAALAQLQSEGQRDARLFAVL